MIALAELAHPFLGGSAVRFVAVNTFVAHLGLAGGFAPVAWLDPRDAQSS